MSQFIKTILLACVISATIPTIMQADSYRAPLNTSKWGYQVLANQISAQYAVKAATVKKIINCESSWNPNALKITSREHSVGLVQINLKAHTDVTNAQAKDPTFAISYLAQNLSEGNGHMWTCDK